MFVVRPGAERLKGRITVSIASALGRPVEVSSVNLRFLPKPGFELSNLVVHDSPSFGPEPILRSSEVVAVVRLSSLLRGRIEIGRLALTEPSFNLVNDSHGHWNLEDLLKQVAAHPAGPTGKKLSGARPAFPYIEADSGRINLKIGKEKSPYALMDADFAVWQDSENTWGMRLKARPVHTDFNLTDVGLVRLNATWQRAAMLRDTPVQLAFQWDRAQLGQITKLAFGNDKGWRGAMGLLVTASGTPADLKVRANASIQDFRRFDIVGGGPILLSTQCGGKYSSTDSSFSDIACRSPIADGSLVLAGKLGTSLAFSYDLHLTADKVPMSSVAALALHAKKDLPDDLTSSGEINASVRMQRSVKEARWKGSGEIRDLHVASQHTKANIVAGRVPLAVSGSWTDGSTRRRTQDPPVLQVDIGPISLPAGRPAPATVQARVSQTGYKIDLRGDTQIQRLIQVATTFGVPVPQPAADGLAKVDLQIAGPWKGFVLPVPLGTVQLQGVRAEVRGVNAPLEIASAKLTLLPGELRVRDIFASVDGSNWRGSLVAPRSCRVAHECRVQFDLHTSEISTARLVQLVGPRPAQRVWYRFLSAPQAGTSYLRMLRGTGKVHADRLKVHGFTSTRVSAKVELEDGELHLSDLKAAVFGGTHSGMWNVDYSKGTPHLSGTGKFDHVALHELAATMGDDWITGTATATYRFSAVGTDLAQLVSAAKGDVEVEARDGSLPHVELGDEGSLQMNEFFADLAFEDGKLEVRKGKLVSGSGIYEISGTASLGRDIDLKFAGISRSYNVSGSLARPHVEAVSETRAELKP